MSLPRPLVGPPRLPREVASDLLADRLALRLALWIALAAWFLGAWLTQPYTFGLGHDWTYFTHHATASYLSWTKYAQVPQWNPWFCGGIPELGNVQSDAISPDFLLTLPFSLHAGQRLRILFMMVLGMEGAYRYAHHQGTKGGGALLAGVLFALSGRFVHIFADGQPVFFGFELLPWALLGLEKGYDNLRWALLGAVAMTWVFFDGGAIATPCIGVTMLVVVLRDTVVRSVWGAPDRPRRRHWYRPARSLAVIGLLAGGLAAVRLLPVMTSFVSHPRTWHGEENYSITQVLGMLFQAPGAGGYSDPGTSYVGVLALLALGVAFFWRDRATFLILAALLAIVDLAMGNTGPVGLWKAVHALPVLKDFRNPFRFTLPAALFVALGASRAVYLSERALLSRVRDLVDRVARPTGPWTLRPRVLAVPFVAAVGLAGLALGAAIAREPLKYNHTVLQGVARHAMAPWIAGGFRQSLGNRWLADVWPAANLGSIGCFEEQPFPTSPALRGDLPAEEYFADHAGEVKRVSWSPHRIVLRVSSEHGGVLVVNQNAHRGWSTDLGQIVARDGLLAARVPPGVHTVTFAFFDPLVLRGGVVSFATVLGAVGLFGWDWSRRRRLARSVVPSG